MNRAICAQKRALAATRRSENTSRTGRRHWSPVGETLRTAPGDTRTRARKQAVTAEETVGKTGFDQGADCARISLTPILIGTSASPTATTD